MPNVYLPAKASIKRPHRLNDDKHENSTLKSSDLPHRDDRHSLVTPPKPEMTNCTVLSSLDAGFLDMAVKVGSVLYGTPKR